MNNLVHTHTLSLTPTPVELKHCTSGNSPGLTGHPESETFLWRSLAIASKVTRSRSINDATWKHSISLDATTFDFNFSIIPFTCSGRCFIPEKLGDFLCLFIQFNLNMILHKTLSGFFIRSSIFTWIFPTAHWSLSHQCGSMHWAQSTSSQFLCRHTSLKRSCDD